MKAKVLSIELLTKLVKVEFGEYEYAPSEMAENLGYISENFKLPTVVVGLYDIDNFKYQVGDIIDDAPFNYDLMGTDYANNTIYFGDNKTVQKQFDSVLDMFLTKPDIVSNQLHDYSSGEKYNIFDGIFLIKWEFGENTLFCTDIMLEYAEDVFGSFFSAGLKPSKELVFFCNGCSMDDSSLIDDFLYVAVKMFPKLESESMTKDEMEEHKELYLDHAYKHMTKNKLQDLYFEFYDLFFHNFDFIEPYRDYIELVIKTYNNIKKVQKSSDHIFYLKYQSETSNKVYIAETKHAQLILQYGKPDKITVLRKDFESCHEAHTELIKKVISKLKSGYQFDVVMELIMQNLNKY